MSQTETRFTKFVMRAAEVLWFIAAIGTVAGSIWLAVVIHWIAGIVVGAVWAGMFWLVDQAIGDGEWDEDEDVAGLSDTRRRET